jgi:hypothetical protein
MFELKGYGGHTFLQSLSIFFAIFIVIDVLFNQGIWTSIGQALVSTLGIAIALVLKQSLQYYTGMESLYSWGATLAILLTISAIYGYLRNRKSKKNNQ